MASLTAEVEAPTPEQGLHDQALRGRVAELDGLRGLALLAMLAYSSHLLTGGWLAPTVFFVLSGYLITTLLVTRLRTDGTRTALRQFYERRAQRLLPCLLVFLLAVAVFARLVAAPTDRGAIRNETLAALLYGYNWHTIFTGRTYGDIFVAPTPLHPLWTLSVEEQFYILWPLSVVALLLVSRRRVLLSVSAVVATASTVLMVWLSLSGASFTRIYEGTDARIAELLIGSALAAAMLGRRWGPPPGWLELASLAAAGVLVWFACAVDLHDPIVFRGGILAIALATAVIVHVLVRPGTTVLARVLRPRPFAWLGRISYGAYLWHGLVYQVVNRATTPLEGVALAVPQMGLSILAGAASFRWVERPFLDGRRQVRHPAITWPAAMCVVAFVMVVATADARAPEAFERRSVDGYATASAPHAPRVMVVGDSVAYTFAEPATLLRDELGQSFVDRSVLGCELVYSGLTIQPDPTFGEKYGDLATRPAKPCDSTWDRDIDRLDPTAVVVILGAPPIHRAEIDGAFRSVCDRDLSRHVENHLTVRLSSLGDRVPNVAIATIPYAGVPGLVNVVGRTDCANKAIRRAAARSGARLIDLNGHLCRDGACDTELDGHRLRSDGLHFEWPGVRPVVRWLFPQVVEGAPRPGAAASSEQAFDDFCSASKPAWSPVVDSVTSYRRASAAGRGDQALDSALGRIDLDRLSRTVASAPAERRQGLRTFLGALADFVAANAEGRPLQPLDPAVLRPENRRGAAAVEATALISYTCGIDLSDLRLLTR